MDSLRDVEPDRSPVTSWVETAFGTRCPTEKRRRGCLSRHVHKNLSVHWDPSVQFWFPQERTLSCSGTNVHPASSLPLSLSASSQEGLPWEPHPSRLEHVGFCSPPADPSLFIAGDTQFTAAPCQSGGMFVKGTTGKSQQFKGGSRRTLAATAVLADLTNTLGSTRNKPGSKGVQKALRFEHVGLRSPPAPFHFLPSQFQTPDALHAANQPIVSGASLSKTGNCSGLQSNTLTRLSSNHDADDKENVKGGQSKGGSCRTLAATAVLTDQADTLTEPGSKRNKPGSNGVQKASRFEHVGLRSPPAPFHILPSQFQTPDALSAANQPSSSGASLPKTGNCSGLQSKTLTRSSSNHGVDDKENVKGGQSKGGSCRTLAADQATFQSLSSLERGLEHVGLRSPLRCHSSTETCSLSQSSYPLRSLSQVKGGTEGQSISHIPGEHAGGDTSSNLATKPPPLKGGSCWAMHAAGLGTCAFESPPVKSLPSEGQSWAYLRASLDNVDRARLPGI